MRLLHSLFSEKEKKKCLVLLCFVMLCSVDIPGRPALFSRAMEQEWTWVGEEVGESEIREKNVFILKMSTSYL